MELHQWTNDPVLNEWYYSFKDADGLEWTINLVPWYESQESPWEASLVSEKKLIGLHFPGRYLDDDIDLLKADAIRRVAGLFPCGEGAGYAGGIVSAAIDGERCAEAVALANNVK